MKSIRLLATLLTLGLVSLCTGCGKKEPPAPPAAPVAPKPPAPPAAAAPAPAAAAPAAATPAATAPAADASAAPAAAAPTIDPAIVEKAQKLIEQAQALAKDTKYQEAADVLKGLADLQLTPEQQKLVDDLKALIQKNVTSDPAGAATKAVEDVAK